jgi:hypothetical protein
VEELAGGTQTWVSGLGLARGLRLHEARELAKLTGTAIVAERRQSGRSTREDHVWFEDWWMVASLCDE